MNKLIKKSVVWFFPALIILIFIFSIFSYSFLKEELTNQILTYGILAIFIFCLLLEIIPQNISPHLVLLISYLFGFNIIITTLLVMIGSLMGSGLGFALGRYYGSDLMRDLISEKTIDKVQKMLNNNHGRLYVSLSAISPLPYVPLVFGALGMQKRNFLYFGLVVRTLSFAVLAIILYFAKGYF